MRFIARDFPLEWPALEGAVLAHCAGRERYFEVVDALLSDVRGWRSPGSSQGALAEIGVGLGLEPSRFKECLADGELENRIINSIRAAIDEYQVSSTPTFIINGEKHVGALPMETLSRILDGLLP